MIIWKKLGILGLVLPFGLGAFLQLLFGDEANYAGIGYILGAIPVWYLGRKWNQSIEQKNNLSSNTNKTSKHSLFWIHLEYWAILFTIIGIIILVSENLFKIGTDPSFIIAGTVALGIISYQIYSKYKKPVQEENSSFQAALESIKHKTGETKHIEKTQASAPESDVKAHKPSDHSKYMPKSIKKS